MFLSNLKTTLLGAAVGFLNLYANGVSPKNALLSIGLGLLGAFSKDYNATGGNKPTSPEAELRVDRDKKYASSP